MSIDKRKSAQPNRWSREYVAELQAAILQNVSNLAAAAASLLEIGRHEQAYALAEAAAKEIGKYMLVIRIGIEVTFGGPRTDWTRFWGKFHDHGVKAWNAALADYLVADRLEDWATGNVDAISADTVGLEVARYQAAVMVELRERALYVDFREGKVRRPAEQISREPSAMMVQAVAGLLERFQALGIVADAERLKAMASDKELRARAEALRKVVNRTASLRASDVHRWAAIYWWKPKCLIGKPFRGDHVLNLSTTKAKQGFAEALLGNPADHWTPYYVQRTLWENCSMSGARTSAGDPARTLTLLWRDSAVVPRHGPRQGLSIDAVVAAATRVADTEGLEAVTMRRVAKALGVVPMTLYTYVPGKAELLDLMLDAAYATMPRLDTSGQPWRQRLAAVAEENVALFDTHPWAATVSTIRPPLGPGMMAKYEHELSALEGLGLDDVQMDASLSYLLGFVQAWARAAADARAVEHNSAMDDSEWWATSGPLLARVLDATAYPIAVRVGLAAGAAHGSAYSLGHAYTFGLELVLAGLSGLIGRGPGT